MVKYVQQGIFFLWVMRIRGLISAILVDIEAIHLSTKPLPRVWVLYK
jgi:hypothetical protein